MSDSRIVRIMCPCLSCQRILAVPADARGKLVRCRGCGMTIRVPRRRPTTTESGEGTSSAAAG